MTRTNRNQLSRTTPLTSFDLFVSTVVIFGTFWYVFFALMSVITLRNSETGQSFTPSNLQICFGIVGGVSGMFCLAIPIAQNSDKSLLVCQIINACVQIGIIGATIQNTYNIKSCIGGLIFAVLSIFLYITTLIMDGKAKQENQHAVV